MQIGSSSAYLIGKGAVRKTHNNDRTGLFVSGMQALFENEQCSSVAFLAHWFHGYITQEELELRGERQIALADLPQVLLNLEEETRYIICKRISSLSS